MRRAGQRLRPKAGPVYGAAPQCARLHLVERAVQVCGRIGLRGIGRLRLRQTNSGNGQERRGPEQFAEHIQDTISGDKS
jgi:hypothetical protein